jgi:hypothetical protein
LRITNQLSEDFHRKDKYTMAYSTPELLSIGSAQHLVLGDDSLPERNCTAFDGVEGKSNYTELW